jgi:hypothetical protein
VPHREHVRRERDDVAWAGHDLGYVGRGLRDQRLRDCGRIGDRRQPRG